SGKRRPYALLDRRRRNRRCQTLQLAWSNERPADWILPTDKGHLRRSITLLLASTRLFIEPRKAKPTATPEWSHPFAAMRASRRKRRSLENRRRPAAPPFLEHAPLRSSRRLPPSRAAREAPGVPRRRRVVGCS